MSSLQFFYSATGDLSRGVVNFGTDTVKCMLTNTLPLLTDHFYSDISPTELAAGNGYTTGGAIVSGVSLTNVSGVETLSANPVTWIAVGGPMGPFQYPVYYDATTLTLIGFLNYGSPLILNGSIAQPFTVSLVSAVLWQMVPAP